MFSSWSRTFTFLPCWLSLALWLHINVWPLSDRQEEVWRYISPMCLLHTQSVASGAVSCSCALQVSHKADTSVWCVRSRHSHPTERCILQLNIDACELNLQGKKEVFLQCVVCMRDIDQDAIWPVISVRTWQVCLWESGSCSMAAAQEYPVNRNSRIWYAAASCHRRKLICL